MLVSSEISTPTHEKVVHFTDSESGLNCIIAIHNTKRGPALGGTRFWTYGSEEDHLKDVLALSEAMTYKNAAAELPYGGGKAVINLKGVEKTEALLKSYAEAVNYMNGKYITAEDVGCKPGDLETIAKYTDYCPKESLLRKTAVSSSPATAFGVYIGMSAAIELHDLHGDETFKDCSVLVQGLGGVGMPLTAMLLNSGAEVFVADINADRVEAFRKVYPDAKPLNVDTMFEDFARSYKGQIRVFSPCALGGVINKDNVAIIGELFDIICGGANNPADKDVVSKIGEEGSLFCPDFIVNAGGVISIHHDIIGTDRAKGGFITKIIPDLYKIHARILEILRFNQLDPMKAAIEYAKKRI